MTKKSEEFINTLIEWLPSTITEYRNSIEFNGAVLETVIIEDVIMPEILHLLRENKDTYQLKRIFDYFEEICNSEDPHLLNTFSITVLEVLGNDRYVLEIATMYMGPKTKQLQVQADINLGRFE